MKREKSELKDAIEAESEVKINKVINIEKEKIKTSEEQKYQFKILEKEKFIERLNEQLKETQRKVEQGSMQLARRGARVGYRKMVSR